jgi:hypothetical protein
LRETDQTWMRVTPDFGHYPHLRARAGAHISNTS